MLLSSTNGTNRCDCREHPTIATNMIAAKVFTEDPWALDVQLTVRTPPRKWHFRVVSQINTTYIFTNSRS